VFVAAPGVEILDLVGPLQVFARASEMHSRANPGSAPIYSVEVVTISWARLHAKRRPAVTPASAAKSNPFAQISGHSAGLIFVIGEVCDPRAWKPVAAFLLSRSM
jgi:hypothetical protein